MYDGTHDLGDDRKIFSEGVEEGSVNHSDGGLNFFVTALYNMILVIGLSALLLTAIFYAYSEEREKASAEARENAMRMQQNGDLDRLKLWISISDMGEFREPWMLHYSAAQSTPDVSAGETFRQAVNRLKGVELFLFLNNFVENGKVSEKIVADSLSAPERAQVVGCFQELGEAFKPKDFDPNFEELWGLKKMAHEAVADIKYELLPMFGPCRLTYTILPETTYE